MALELKSRAKASGDGSSGSLVRVDKGLARDAVAARQAMERRITDAAPRAGDWLQAGF